MLTTLVFLVFFYLIGTILTLRLGRKEVKLFHIIFIFNVLISILMYYIYIDRYGVPYYIGGSDDLVYEQQAAYAYESLGIFDYSSLKEIFWMSNSLGYTYLVSIFFRIASFFDGYHTLVPRFFNGLLLAFISVFVYKISMNYMGLKQRFAFLAAVIVGCSPIMSFNAAHVFRDIVVTFIMVLVIYLALGFYKFNLWEKSMAICGMFILFVILYEIRYMSAYFLVIQIIFTMWAAYRNSKNKPLKLKNIMSISIIVLLFILIFNTSLVNTIFNYYEIYADYRTERTDGLAQYVFNAPLYVGFFLRVVYLSITPFPILSSELERDFLSIGTIVQLFLMPYVLIGIRKSFSNSNVATIMFSFIVVYISVSMLSFTIRHICLFYPFMILLAFYGYQNANLYFKHKKMPLVIVYFMILIGITMYSILKFY
ncbi:MULTISPECIES: hypothetical protein [Bacillus]|uniref:hypothetical protein n=1 Tax=Bacillus TaxID=1386 RepID=UPI000BEDD744|nr:MULTISPECIES: hypothetical protein [Bacillus]MCX2827559.1 hypothetical protein [Bacillus sp. DHT2]MDR4917196.1 hypothetical protein [Bacillus pseudomycoides]MED4651385.1 hypothetical protein [Bacillus pseudomycoides]PEB42770.1 hypothetical protein COO06_04075 [Bacillus pseudomycoides]PEE04657.1 hypothetical protein CON86_18490 [Bacillus pseudomycoides]